VTSPIALNTSAIQGTAGGVSTDTSRLETKENLKAAGEKFEAIFTGMMLKSMRQTKLADGLFDSKGEDQFRDMMDQKLSQSMATHSPIGIGKAVTDFLAKAASTAEAEQKQAMGTAPAADGDAA
jgi:peptidoglycan hydrolase FlgJ